MSSQTISIIITALLPVLVLLYVIYKKDSEKPEPVKQLVKAFLLGILSVPITFVLLIPLQMLNLVPEYNSTIADSIGISFFGAAIPEEIAKLIILWLFLRKNKFFDEKMDGIVYAVCVSMGFAALENVMYLFSDVDAYWETGVARAVTAIPGHFCFGVIMGYYYSLAKFYKKNKSFNKLMTLVAPILAHGIYDSIIFITEITPELSAILTIVFMIFCIRMWRFASSRIKEHIERDQSDIFKVNMF